MPRPLSDSWQYFELLAPDNGRSRKARCNFCGHEQAAGITRLHQHLLYRCSRISSEIRDQLRQKQDDRGKESPSKGNDLLQHHNPIQSSVDYHHFDSALQNTLNHSPPGMNPHSTYYEATLSPATSTNFSTASLAFPPNTNSVPQQHHQPQQHQSQQHHQQQQQQQPQQQPQQTQPQQQQNDRSQAMLDWQLARALFAAHIPFEKIENPHMVEFFRRLQPNYIVPKGRRLQQFLLKEQHWDLIQWDEPNNTATQITSSPPAPPSLQPTVTQPPILQQRSSNVGRMMMGPESNTTNSNATIGNRLLSTLHPPAELEGSL